MIQINPIARPAGHFAEWPRWRRAQFINQRLMGLMLLLGWVLLLTLRETPAISGAMAVIPTWFTVVPWDVFTASMLLGAVALLVIPWPRLLVYFLLTTPLLVLLYQFNVYVLLYSSNLPLYTLFLDLFYLKLLVNYWGYT